MPEAKGKDMIIKILIAVLLIALNGLVWTMKVTSTERHESYIKWQEGVDEDLRVLNDRSIIAVSDIGHIIEDLAKVEKRIEP